MTPIERRYRALVDRYGELELSPSRFKDIERSTVFVRDPDQPPNLVAAPLAYRLVETPGFELRVRPLLILTLKRRKGRPRRYVYCFEYRLGADVVPDTD